MFSKKWATSPRRYEVIHDREVAIPVSAGFALDCDVFGPDSPEMFPAILSAFPFHKEPMFEPLMPRAIAPASSRSRAAIRISTRVAVTCRSSSTCAAPASRAAPSITSATGRSRTSTRRSNGSPGSWCDGQVATFGTSYFAMTAKRVAELEPPSLKTIFAPFATADQYRGAMFHGGIF